MQMKIVMGDRDIAFDPTDYKNPLTYSMNANNFLDFDLDQNYYWQATFRLNEVNDEKYDFVGDRLKETFIDYESIKTRGLTRDSTMLHCTPM